MRRPGNAGNEHVDGPFYRQIGGGCRPLAHEAASTSCWRDGPADQHQWPHHPAAPQGRLVEVLDHGKVRRILRRFGLSSMPWHNDAIASVHRYAPA